MTLKEEWATRLKACAVAAVAAVAARQPSSLDERMPTQTHSSRHEKMLPECIQRLGRQSARFDGRNQSIDSAV